MPIPAKDLIQRVVGTLQDMTSIRWTVDELARYFNDGQREIIIHRPDAVVITGPVTLVAGSRQTLPAGATKLRDVPHNNTGQKRAITLVPKQVLDAQLSGWHGQTAVTEILHYMYDPLEPRNFMVYPPAIAGASVQATYAVMPADIPVPAPGGTFTSVTGDMALPDIYGNPMQDYILARCYLKDSEYAGNAQRGIMHAGMFATALGVEVKATLAFAPTVTARMGLAATPAAS